jgi:hypothetical protein
LLPLNLAVDRSSLPEVKRVPRTGRPVARTRGERTPFGKLLDERGISARSFGEALGEAEERAERVPTEDVNLWIYGRRQPGQIRQALIARLLGVSRFELFPGLTAPRKPRPKPSAGTAELRLVDGAPDEIEQRVAKQLATGQERLPAGAPSMHYRALKGSEMCSTAGAHHRATLAHNALA